MNCWHCGDDIAGRSWSLDSAVGIRKPVCERCVESALRDAEEFMANLEAELLWQQLEERLRGRNS